MIPKYETNIIEQEIKSMVNKLKNQYEKDLSQKAKDNPKAIWNYIKSNSKQEKV
jgi:ribosomal protein S17E